jgi:hypothetical protein
MIFLILLFLIYLLVLTAILVLLCTLIDQLSTSNCMLFCISIRSRDRTSSIHTLELVALEKYRRI